jgi:hypothetical protein
MCWRWLMAANDTGPWCWRKPMSIMAVTAKRLLVLKRMESSYRF